MSKKLGELLNERGVHTDHQLEEALLNQLLVGGHLGTAVLELGYADEESLGRTLSEVHNVPYAAPEILARARKPILELVSRRTVEQCHVIPLERSGKKLLAAMVNPRNIGALDTVSFESGLRVVPWVAPEFRIFEAMERCYGVPRRPRYVSLSAAMSSRPPQPRPAKRESKAAKTQPLPIEPSFEGDLGAPTTYNRPWTEVAEEMFPTGAATKVDVHKTVPGVGWEHLTNRLCSSGDRDDVAHAVLDELKSTLARVALFAVGKAEMTLWEARGIGTTGNRLAPLPVARNGALMRVVQKEHYRGPLGGDAKDQEFCAWLGIEAPADAILVPVRLNDRLVALVYGDAGRRGRIEGATENYLRLSRMLAMALLTIVYKNKIREIGSLTYQEHP